MKRYAAYLFDLDGTLVDTAPDLNEALNHTLASRGYATVDESLTRHWVGHGARALISQALLSQGSGSQGSLSPGGDQQNPPATLLEELVTTFIGYYESHIADHSKPYPDVVATLAHLAERGTPLAVVTNKLTRLSVPLLSALDLDQYFQAIVCGDTAAQPKPAADPAVFACQRLGVAIPSTLFVGDSTTDVDCARAAGCPVVVVRDGYNQGVPAAELGADSVIESFSDLV